MTASGSEELESELGELEKKQIVTAGKLDQAIASFATAVPPLAEPWIRREVQSRIEANPEQVESLGVPKLSQLKKDIQTLVDQLPGITASETSKVAKYPHRVERTDEFPGHYVQRYSEEYFSGVYRSVISNLGAVLAKYDLLEENGYPSWERGTSGTYHYRINTGFDGRAIAAVAEYNDLYVLHENSAATIRSRRAELKKAKARKLWDSA